MYDLVLNCYSDGRSRGFAFVGFSSNKEAKQSVKYFNSTFIDTSRIQVELAKPRGDATLERPWSKYSRGSSAFDSRQESSTAPAPLSETAAEKQRVRAELEKKKKFLMSIYGAAEGEDEGELKRFMSAMKSKGKTKTWENDDEAFAGPSKDVKAKAPKKKKKPKVKVDVSAVPSRKAGAHGALVEQVHLKFEESSSEEEESENEERDQYSRAFGGSDSDDDLYEEMGPAIETDIEETAEVLIEDEENPEQNLEKKSDAPAEEAPQELSPELIADTGRLFVRNLSYACTEDDLRGLFEPFGPLTEVHMPIVRETKKPKGFAYILFMLPEHALKAYSALDGTIFQGRLLHVLPAKEKPVREEPVPAGQSSFKTKQEQERKAQGDQDYNWNSLFIRSDTILDAIAVHLGVPKSQIMDTRSSDNLATRLAVAETHLIQETKQYLEAQGVQLDAFKSATERSNTLLLAKNLPFETDAAELRKLFSKFGSLGRVVLPPATKAIALIEFVEASEARTAFRALAYSRFHGVPLYLEWAPIAALKPRTADDSNDDEHEEEAPVHLEEEVVVRQPSTKATDLLAPADEDGPVLGAPTLYVSNLNWSTPADTLKQIFASAGSIRSVRLATKKDPRTGQTLSMGFGFVEFDQPGALNRALDTLQGTVVDGHALVLRRSTQPAATTAGSKAKGRKDNPAQTEASTKATKLIIRNVPFEATEKDLKSLFSSFAQLKRLRLPRRFNGQHRGFAFAEFLTHAEAASALTTLAHTHLYGRHLVLEWAKETTAMDGEDEETQLQAQLEAEAMEARRKAAKRAASDEPGMRQRTKASRVALGDDADDIIPAEDD